MYDIRVMSKEECFNFTHSKIKDKCIIISINDQNRTILLNKENKNIVDILRLHFDDIPYPIENYTLMNKEHSEKIKNFIDKYKGSINNIVVHCNAGISRSGAVGCILARYLNGSDDDMFRSGKYIPNKHIYKLMAKEFNLDYSEELFKNKMDLKYTEKSSNNITYYYDEDICDIELIF